MHTRGCSKKRTQDPETEEGKEEQETETIQDTEMEQPAGDKEEARGELNLIQLWDLMKEYLRKIKRSK